MELNYIAKGIELAGTTIKNLSIKNTIVDVESDAKRSFGMEINEPVFENIENEIFAQITIDFEIDITQEEGQTCNIQMSLEGAFWSNDEVNIDAFKELVVINGAAALVGIARGKIESLSSCIFNNGKVVIPFVNIIDYYKDVLTD